MLLDHGASPHTMNSSKESPLLLGQSQLPPLSRDARHSSSTHTGLFASLVCAAVRAGSYQMVSTLIAGGARVEQVCLKKWTAMHEASMAGCVHVLELLLENGGKVCETDQHGVTPLGIAAEYSHPEVLELLLTHGEHIISH